MNNPLYNEVPVVGNKYSNGDWQKYAIHDDKNIKGFFGEYRYLSNFHVADVYFDGLKYPSSECAYQAAKTLETSLREEFVSMTPSQAKKGGSIIDLRPDWEDVKTEVMASIVFDKFYRNIDLRRKLIETGDKYLEESNHWSDRTWGVCKGTGENRLGRILMRTRSFWS
jgi:hypothetical protein